MRKFFVRSDAEDFEDLPSFSEERMSLAALLAGVCALAVVVAAVTGAIVCLLQKKKQ